MPYYADYPGYSALDGAVPPAQRLYPTLRGALQHAVNIYARSPNVVKVVVCEYPSARRVRTIFGLHHNPTILPRDDE